MKSGLAIYNESANRLEVVRPGESSTRHIPCTNLRPAEVRVFGVQVEGDEIWVLVGPKHNQRPNRKILYRFSSLSGGSSAGL